MRILVAAILFIIPTILHAADLCDAGYYLADNDECTICPSGTYSDAGATECTTGYSKLHIGTRTFNLWPADKCTSPSLRTNINNDVCCVNMTPGSGPGINVELHDRIYHTTN